jgi:hypothetical protein
MTAAIVIYFIMSVIASVLVAAFLKGAALDASFEGKRRPTRKSRLHRRSFAMAAARLGVPRA